jgi:hypothetical protein
MVAIAPLMPPGYNEYALYVRARRIAMKPKGRLRIPLFEDRLFARLTPLPFRQIPFLIGPISEWPTNVAQAAPRRLTSARVSAGVRIAK